VTAPRPAATAALVATFTGCQAGKVALPALVATLPGCRLALPAWPMISAALMEPAAAAADVADVAQGASILAGRGLLAA
jgi:hypothetical protein